LDTGGKNLSSALFELVLTLSLKLLHPDDQILLRFLLQSFHEFLLGFRRREAGHSGEFFEPALIDSHNILLSRGYLAEFFFHLFGFLIYISLALVEKFFFLDQPVFRLLDALFTFFELQLGLRQDVFGPGLGFVYYSLRFFPGSEFGLLTSNSRLELHHRGLFGGTRGVAGLWGELRDYASGGGVLTPRTQEYGIAGYLFETFELDRWTFDGAFRYDLRWVSPREDFRMESVSRQRGEPVFATNRNFNNFAAAVSATYQLASDIEVGSVLMRSFRAPGRIRGHLRTPRQRPA
jgi:hypothetical protein